MFYQKRIQRFRFTFIPTLLVGVVCTNLSTVQSASSTSTTSYLSTTKVITSAQPTSITQTSSTQKTSTSSQASTTSQSNSFITSATTSTIVTAAAISTTSTTEKSSPTSTTEKSTSTATATITAAATSTAKATTSTAAATSTAATTIEIETTTLHSVATTSVTLTSFLETSKLVPTTTMKVSTTPAVTTTECDVLTSHPTSSHHQSTELLLESQDPFGSVIISGQSPFQTDGLRELSLTCLVKNVTNSVHFFWNVTCVRKTNDTCVLKPHPPEDDGKVVTCTVCNDGGQSTTVAFTLQLLYPPLSPPVIHGYQTGDVLHVGSGLTMTCSVSGGKPVVTSVLFFCPGNPDGPDDENQSMVSSSVTITSLKSSDNGSTCTCTAVWKDQTLYKLSETRILVVNGTEPSQVLSFTYYLIIGVAAGGGVVIILVIVITIVCIRKKANHTYDRPTPNNNKDGLYSNPNPVFHVDSRERMDPDPHVYNDLEDTSPYSFCTKIQDTSADPNDLSSV